MINLIIQTLFALITWLVNIILTPINLLFDGLFPDLPEFGPMFSALLSKFIPYIHYLISYIPPTLYFVMRAYVSFIVDFYLIYWSYLAITKLWTILQKIKFW